MLWMCFSTVPSVTHNWRAIPAFERPSAIRASTSRSRGLSSSSGSRARRAATSSWASAGAGGLLDEPGVDDGCAVRDPLEGRDEVVDIGDAALQQVAGPAAAREQ